MDMFTSYGHIKKPKKITDFLMTLACASPFKINMQLPQSAWIKLQVRVVVCSPNGLSTKCPIYSIHVPTAKQVSRK